MTCTAASRIIDLHSSITVSKELHPQPPARIVLQSPTRIASQHRGSCRSAGFQLHDAMQARHTLPQATYLASALRSRLCLACCTHEKASHAHREKCMTRRWWWRPALCAAMACTLCACVCYVSVCVCELVHVLVCVCVCECMQGQDILHLALFWKCCVHYFLSCAWVHAMLCTIGCICSFARACQL